jgi:hypothetical protein
VAYEYKKLSEVEAIDIADSSVNLIVETEDEIKKLNIGDLPIGGQEQADWNEEDETKASFIKNKPDLSNIDSGGSSSGGEVIIIKVDNNYMSPDWHYADGTDITLLSLKAKLEAGAIVYIERYITGYGAGNEDIQVIGFRYRSSFTDTSGYYEKSNLILYFIVSEYVSSLSKNIGVFKSITLFGD